MITTHVVDTAIGRPAAGIAVVLEMRKETDWSLMARGVTDPNGRLDTLTEGREIVPGTYRLTFDIGAYQRNQGIQVPFFPEAKITFNVRDIRTHYHLPLLLSPFGYSTYREQDLSDPPDDHRTGSPQ
jgi:5-hydroxyisourate hydrolase